jgi:hypothetical protein
MKEAEVSRVSVKFQGVPEILEPRNATDWNFIQRAKEEEH